MKKFENAKINDKCYIYNRKNVTLREAIILLASENHITVQDGYKINSYTIYPHASIIGGESGEIILSSRSTVDWLAIEDFGVNKEDLETALYNFRVNRRGEGNQVPFPDVETKESATNYGGCFTELPDERKEELKKKICDETNNHEFHSQPAWNPLADKPLDKILEEAVMALQKAREALKTNNEMSFKERLKSKIKDFIDKI